MKAHKMMKLLSLLIMLLAGCLPLLAGDGSSAVKFGQSVTLLPDGSTLVLGGFEASGRPSNAAIVRDRSSRDKALAGLQTARAGHTATVLPDGTVFIFGGLGADGKIVATSELFDPATQIFTTLPDVLAIPRAFHTATLLTDGTLLLAGGIEAGGEFPDDVQLWDFRTHHALSQHALLMTARQGHTAVLLSDGAVRISGGTDHFGRPVLVDEMYDPATGRFRFSTPNEMSVQQEQESQSGARIAESIPADGAADVPVNSLIGIRFTRLLNLTSVNHTNFVLQRPNGSAIEARVSAAEGGRLAFVLPSAPLEPGTTYTLTITNAADSTGNSLSETSVSFTTAGQPLEPADSDADASNPTSRFQQLPPLRATPGQTALAGQVLKLNGWPLEHVTLEIDGHKTQTDSSGRFLLKDLQAGHQVLWIDGSSANQPKAEYGVYEVGVTIIGGKTNVLNYTIWMTRLDTAHAVNIPSPTTRETVITNPNLPGLELHLPAGTVITDRYGKVVRQVGITQIPLDKPPFPLPQGVQVPIYFTVQPGGAYLKVLNPGSGPRGARLIYPNASNLKPGTPFDFWNYDADVKGWVIYGQGHVSPDGRNVFPDPGVVIYEFTGAMVGGPGDAPGTGNYAGGSKKKDADPVDLSTGQFNSSKTDLMVEDVIPLALTRTYTTNDSRTRSFGIGATDNYDIFMVGDTNPYTYQELILPDGSRVRFDRISSGTSYGDAIYTHVSANDSFYGARLQWVGTVGYPPGPWQMTLRDGTIYYFPESPGSTNPNCQGLVGIRDRYGNQVRFDRSNHLANCNLNSITSPNGRYITLTRDSQGRITQAQDNSGRTVTYAYDGAGRLSTVTDVGGDVTTYTYDDQNRMLTIKDARGVVYLTNQYDSSGRVIQQTEADGGTYLFSWTGSGNTIQSRTAGGTVVNSGSYLVSSGCWLGSGVDSFNRYSSSCSEGYLPLVTQVDVTDPRGYVRRVQFGSTGYPASDTHALGQPEQQSVTYTYYSDNLLKSVTDALGRSTSFDYDTLGNRTRVTRLDGTPNAVTSSMTYNGPFYELSSLTDPLGHTSTFAYDASGNLIQATDPLNHQTSMTYNPNGQIASVSDALNNTVQFGYFQNDPVSVTDPLGGVSTSFYDAVGRVISASDAQGNTSQFQFNRLNLLTQVTDAKGNNTSFSYDPNGNLLSLTDALNHTTTYTYNNMDQVQTRTDPLLRQESYSYDVNGNVVSATDRKGQVTTFSYDALNRLKFVGFNTVVNGGNTTYESTINFTYDAGNRMTQAVDSAGGTITRSYDNLDRLTSETTAQGSITYEYDNGSRMTSMQVVGQPQVTYAYDNANRITQITQSSSTTSLGYDNGNRRTSLTLPNGLVVSYSYDNGSRLTGITYQFGTNTLGNLTYAYDVLNRRVGTGGSFARTGLPAAIASASYDAANELTYWNGTAMSYDANGNMLGDGTNSFTWNARNQVAKLNNVSLQYDVFGRRTKNAAGTSFLYNGANAVQELSGSTVSATLLNGGIDEVFSRSDSLGAFTPLKDALGSTIALVDSSGNVQTSYTYEPFGNTSVTGTSNGNEFQYTGRENEGNGLYYYRARYYSPLFGRFINEDPLGVAGGLNLYSYVLDSPTNLIDPSGNCPTCLEPPEVVTTTTVAGIAAGTAAGAGAATSGSGSVVTLVSGGSASGSSAGPVGVVVGVGVAAIGGIVYARYQYNQAEDALERDLAQLSRMQHLENQAIQNSLKQPKPLTGRESKPAGNDDVDSDGSCKRALEGCLNNPWQPSWNIPNFGRKKDCGACYRYCKHNDYWPTDKCPK